MRRHASHRVNLAAELRHEERVHHRRRGKPELHRRAGRHHELVDRGNALVGVYEQPLPIERHDIDAQRLGICGDRRLRIELMRADPGDPAQQDHDQCGDRPGDELNAPFVSDVETAHGARVRCPVPPRERQCRDDDRHDDDEHDCRGVDQQQPLRRRDRTLRIQYSRRTAGRDEQRGADHYQSIRVRRSEW